MENLSVTVDAIGPASDLVDKQKRNLWKNIFAIVFPLFLSSLSTNPVHGLQSSLNMSQGLGTTSSSVSKGCDVLILLFLAPYLIGKLGEKRAIIVFNATVVFFILANIYPTWGTMITGSVLASSWDIALVAQNGLNVQFGIRYGELYGSSRAKGVNFVTALYCGCISFGDLLGNLVSFGVLNAGLQLETNVTDVERQTCGVFFVEEDHVQSDHFRKPEAIYLTALFVSLSVVAIVGIIFTGCLLDATPPKPEKESTFRLLASTLTLNGDWRFLCLFLFNFHAGLFGAFVSADFNKNFTTCLLGMQFVGISSSCNAIGHITSSFVYAFVSKSYGRLPVFVSYASIEIAILLFCLLWVPILKYDYLTVFVVTFLSGCVASGQQILSQALHGLSRPEKRDASFANYHLATACGGMVGNAYSYSLPLSIKIYIILAFTTASSVAYLAVEKSSKNDAKITK